MEEISQHADKTVEVVEKGRKQRRSTTLRLEGGNRDERKNSLAGETD